ncbi:hypothetical protein CRYUN_Cryun07bG0089700 [Craigia yunnanensis]
MNKRSQHEQAEKSDGSRSRSNDVDEDDDEKVDEQEEEDIDDGVGFGQYDYGKNKLFERKIGGDDDLSIIPPSTLGLDHIRTRSTPLPSPLKFFSSAGMPSILEM